MKLLNNLLCFLGKHKLRSVRLTHRNKWSGEICENCGANRTSIERVFNRPFDLLNKKGLNNIHKEAGGNKPNDID